MGIPVLGWMSILIACQPADPTAALDATLVGVPARLQPTWDLATAEGRPVGLPDLLGRWTVVTVGYTSCPDVCPGTLLGVADALDRWEAVDAPIGAVFVAVDPVRDRERLDAYTHHFHPRIVGVTGSDGALQAAVDGLGAAYALTEGPDGVDVQHSTSAFLVDPQGVVQVVHTRPADGATLAREVAAYVEAWEPAVSFEGWIRRPPPGTGAAAGYGRLVDHEGTERTLSAVSSPHAASVHTHETVQIDGIARMRPTTLHVPAGGQARLQPGGAHLMFSRLQTERSEALLAFTLDDGTGFWARVPLRDR